MVIKYAISLRQLKSKGWSALELRIIGTVRKILWPHSNFIARLLLFSAWIRKKRGQRGKEATAAKVYNSRSPLRTCKNRQ